VTNDCAPFVYRPLAARGGGLAAEETGGAAVGRAGGRGGGEARLGLDRIAASEMEVLIFFMNLA
jgi:hypothetical protein